MFRKRVYCFALIALCLLLGKRSFAHPMGNFSVNHYSKISVESDGIRVSYIIDLAEIPTYQELQQGNVTADVADPAVTRFVGLRGVEFGRGLSLVVDGKRLALRLVSSQVIFPPGAGGVPTMKMGFVYRAAYPGVEGTADPSTSLRSGRDDKGEGGAFSNDRLVAERAGSLQYPAGNYPGQAEGKKIV